MSNTTSINPNLIEKGTSSKLDIYLDEWNLPFPQIVTKKTDKIDFQAGIYLMKKIGDYVKVNEIIAIFY